MLAPSPRLRTLSRMSLPRKAHRGVPRPQVLEKDPHHTRSSAALRRAWKEVSTLGRVWRRLGYSDPFSTAPSGAPTGPILLHKGLGSFEATLVDTLEDGTKVYSGPWKACRKEDPRHFVMVEPAANKTLMYWGTPKVKEALEVSQWPRVYRERNTIQELSFKSMIDHGGLDINHGRKTILGLDRHHQRKKEHLEKSLETTHERVDKKEKALKSQQDKVAKSGAKGHGRRLEQRQGTLVILAEALKDAKEKQVKLSEQAATLGQPGPRADRDFRTQTIMTIRTLFLEKMLRAFMAALLATLHIQVSLEQVFNLLLERREARMETPSQVVYWVNTAGFSQSKRRLLGKIVEGLGAMVLQDQGKPIHVRLKDMPP